MEKYKDNQIINNISFYQIKNINNIFDLVFEK
jgi:hypothetical protein